MTPEKLHAATVAIMITQGHAEPDQSVAGGVYHPAYNAAKVLAEAALAAAGVDEMAAEAEHLRECMRIAGLQAFMRNRKPMEIAEHLQEVAASSVEQYAAALARLEQARTALAATQAALAECVEWIAGGWEQKMGADAHGVRVLAKGVKLVTKARALLGEGNKTL